LRRHQIADFLDLNVQQFLEIHDELDSGLVFLGSLIGGLLNYGDRLLLRHSAAGSARPALHHFVRVLLHHVVDSSHHVTLKFAVQFVNGLAFQKGSVEEFAQFLEPESVLGIFGGT